jgi:tetratricopeptide (TPR) repeat protein
MNRLLLALTITFFMVAGCGLGVSEHKDAVLDGLSHLNRGRPEEALESFNRAISIDPTHTDGYLGRANTLNTLGRYQESLEDYNRVIEMNPEIANAYVNRAIAYSHLKRRNLMQNNSSKGEYSWQTLTKSHINNPLKTRTVSGGRQPKTATGIKSGTRCWMTPTNRFIAGLAALR